MASFCSSTACLRQASRIVTSAFSEGVQVNGVLFYVRLERVRVNGDSVFIGFVFNSSPAWCIRSIGTCSSSIVAINVCVWVQFQCYRLLCDGLSSSWK